MRGNDLYGYAAVLIGFTFLCLAPLLEEAWFLALGLAVISLGCFYGTFFCGWWYGA